MPKRKSHIWQKIKGVPGTYKCQRCGMLKYRTPEGKDIYPRQDGRLDRSNTKHNCFILSKD